MSNAETLVGKLEAIGDAIRARTGKGALMTMDEMPAEIASISGGGKVSYSLLREPDITGRFGIFADNAKMYDVLAMFDFANATSLKHLLAQQTMIDEFDFAVVADATPTSLYGMFAPYSLNNCKKLATLKNMGDLDTSAVTAFRELFYKCTALTVIDLSPWDFSSAAGPYGTLNMVSGCTSLQTLVLPASFTTGHGAKFPVAMQDENGTQFAAGDAIPDGAHTYTSI